MWGRGGVWQTTRAWVIQTGWINGCTRLIECDGLDATQWMRRLVVALTSSGRRPLLFLATCPTYIWAPPAHSFSGSSSHRKRMLWKIWHLYNNYDYSLCIIITTMNHYSCLTIIWYSYNNSKQSYFVFHFASFFLFLSLPPRSKAANYQVLEDDGNTRSIKYCTSSPTFRKPRQK